MSWCMQESLGIFSENWYLLSFTTKKQPANKHQNINYWIVELLQKKQQQKNNQKKHRNTDL